MKSQICKEGRAEWQVGCERFDKFLKDSKDGHNLWNKRLSELDKTLQDHEAQIFHFSEAQIFHFSDKKAKL